MRGDRLGRAFFITRILANLRRDVCLVQLGRLLEPSARLSAIRYNGFSLLFVATVVTQRISGLYIKIAALVRSGLDQDRTLRDPINMRLQGSVGFL